MSEPALKTGDFVRIDWSDGSSLAGFINVSSTGLVTLRFGPERSGDTRWITLGFVDALGSFVTGGNLQVLGETQEPIL